MKEKPGIYVLCILQSLCGDLWPETINRSSVFCALAVIYESFNSHRVSCMCIGCAHDLHLCYQQFVCVLF